MDTAQTQQALIAIKALIKNLEDALVALLDPTVQSYSLDTGQSVQRTVRSGDRKKLTDDLQAAYALCNTLTARLTGSGVVQVVPRW